MSLAIPRRLVKCSGGSVDHYAMFSTSTSTSITTSAICVLRARSAGRNCGIAVCHIRQRLPVTILASVNGGLEYQHLTTAHHRFTGCG